MMVYPIVGSGQQVIFTQTVLDHFKKHCQNRCWRREAGGQLFARLELPDILVEEATGPRARDLRTRFSFRPNRAAEQREITSRHKRGLHFVGDWHTHPEARPRASSLDLASMQEMVTKSVHNLNGFLMVIVGTGVFPEALLVVLCDGRTTFSLEPRASDGAATPNPSPKVCPM